MRASAVSTARRANILPDVPTVAEQGLPNYSFDGWIALVGPTGLPAATINKLYNDTKAALATPEVQESLASQGIMVIGSEPDAVAQFFKTKLDKHTKLVKQSGARLE